MSFTRLTWSTSITAGACACMQQHGKLPGSGDAPSMSLGNLFAPTCSAEAASGAA